MKNPKGDGPSRRSFLKQAAALGLSGAVPPSSGSISVATPRSGSQELPARARAFMRDFGLDYPIVQAPTAGPANAALAVAVAEKGAMGAIPLSFYPREVTLGMVSDVLANTSRATFGNYVLHFPHPTLQAVLEAGVSCIQFSFGLPSRDALELISEHNAKLGIQVTSGDNAKRAQEIGADYLVCQGMEAGGHVQASMPLRRALGEVLAVAEDTHVLASGGIATGRDIRDLLDAGASGVVMGTRFVATRESRAHPLYKRALLETGSEDTVYTICFNRGWENANHRVLRNGTFRGWEAAGSPEPGNRPGESDEVAFREDGVGIRRYAGPAPLEGMTGTVEDMAMYAGTGVRDISDLPSAADVIERLWREFGEQA